MTSFPRSAVESEIVLLVDVFGQPTAGVWTASSRFLIVPPGAPGGLLAFSTLRFIENRLRAIGGQALDGALFRLRMLASDPLEPRGSAPLIGRYSMTVARPTSSAAEVREVTILWQSELVAKMAVATIALATASQLTTAARSDFVATVQGGVDAWVLERLRPSSSPWPWGALWQRWVATENENWHKLTNELDEERE